LLVEARIERKVVRRSNQLVTPAAAIAELVRRANIGRPSRVVAPEARPGTVVEDSGAGVELDQGRRPGHRPGSADPVCRPVGCRPHTDNDGNGHEAAGRSPSAENEKHGKSPKNASTCNAPAGVKPCHAGLEALRWAHLGITASCKDSAEKWLAGQAEKESRARSGCAGQIPGTARDGSSFAIAGAIGELLPEVVDSAVGVLTQPGSGRRPSVGSHGGRTLPNARLHRDPKQ
jgi:hypothetical protein